MKILAIIPARGGSKGLKGKNIKILNGKPLIAWTIEAGKKSKYIDRVIVTTDDEQIAKVAKEYGADIPFMRPADLAADDTPGIDPILHAVEYLSVQEGYYPDYIILLQCTSPLRNVEHIDRAIDILSKGKVDSIVSVTKLQHPPYWNKIIDENGYLHDFIKYDSEQKVRRQDSEDIYRLNGAIYIVKTNLMKNKGRVIVGDVVPFVMENKDSIDIDDELDFQLAEFLISQ